jgi:hypothetical protein
MKFCLLPFAGAMLLLGMPALVYAQWKDIPIATAPGSQDRADMAADGSGGALFVWEHNPLPTQAYGPEDIYAQHIRGDGTAAWAANGIAVCAVDGYQGEPHVVADESGGWIVVWTDARDGSRVFAQHLDAAGNALWPENGMPVTSAASAPGNIDVTSDGAGGCVITWAEWSATRKGIYAQRLYGNGTTWGQDVFVAGTSPDTLGSSETKPCITDDGLDGWFIAWFDRGTGDVRAHRLGADGTLLWAAEGMSVCTSHRTYYPKIVSVARGQAMIAWGDRRTGSNVVYTQLIDSLGTVQWQANGLPVSPESESLNRTFTLTPDGQGGGILAWDEGSIFVEPATTIRAQRVLASGQMPWGMNGVVVCDGQAHRGYPIAVGDQTGGAIVVWSDARSGNIAPFAQRVSGNGLVQWTAGGVALSVRVHPQVASRATTDGHGGAIVAISADASKALGAPVDLYTARVGHDGSTPALASLVSAEADAHRVRLRWFLPSSSAAGITLYRQEVASGWRPEAVLTCDALGYAAYEDWRVAPGSRYGYRLGINRGGREILLGETWVAVPQFPALTLEGLRHSSDGGLILAFSVGSAEPTALDVFDQQGRRVVSIDFGRRTPGHHLVALESMRAAASGIYFMRLRQCGRIATMKVHVVR